MWIRDGCAGLSRRSLPLRFKRSEQDWQNHKSACANQLPHKIAIHRRINHLRGVPDIQALLFLSQNAVWHEARLS